MKLAMPLFPVDALGAPATSAGRVHSVLGILTGRPDWALKPFGLGARPEASLPLSLRIASPR
jgi:hypothetical protein